MDIEGSPCWVRVLDEGDSPVEGAEVSLVGGATSRTDARGYAEVTLPGSYYFALVVRYTGHEEVLYMEQLEPGGTYAYRAGSMAAARSEAGGETGHHRRRHGEGGVGGGEKLTWPNSRRIFTHSGRE